MTTEQRMTRILFAFSFAVSTALLVVLALRQPLRTNIAASYLWGTALVGGSVAIGACRGRLERMLRLFLVAAALNLLLVPAEALLRMRGFRYESGIQFGYPRPYQFDVFEPDEELFWRFPPDAPGINSYGFRGPEPADPKERGGFRILFLGNSCTFQGFPGIVEVMLRGEGRGIECLNFATPGYTSHQGRKVLGRYLDELDPDLIVVSFGWNDRWLAYGSIDAEKRITAGRGGAGRVFGVIYSRWRLLQYMRKLVSPLVGRVEPLDTQRVPPERFRGNLVEMGEMGSRRGTPVLFVTEPSSHGALGVPDFVVASRYAASKEASLELWRRYNSILREVAATEEGWRLLDLDAMISGRPDVARIFTGDGLHFSEEGLALVARIEAEVIAEIMEEAGPER